jgi:hypothetical protein
MAETTSSRPNLSERPRIHLLIGILALLILVFLVVQFLYWREENNTEANFYKIRPGMTMKEVQEILGRATSSPAASNDGSTVLTWNLNDGSTISVWFHPNGKATSKYWNHPEIRTKRSLGDIYRDLLRKLGL